MAGSYTRPFMCTSITLSRCSCPVYPRRVESAIACHSVELGAPCQWCCAARPTP